MLYFILQTKFTLPSTNFNFTEISKKKLLYTLLLLDYPITFFKKYKKSIQFNSIQFNSTSNSKKYIIKIFKCFFCCRQSIIVIIIAMIVIMLEVHCSFACREYYLPRIKIDPYLTSRSAGSSLIFSSFSGLLFFRPACRRPFLFFPYQEFLLCSSFVSGLR